MKTAQLDPIYKHRDIDWLSFNARVLQEAKDPSNPLYERIKFLAIFSSNLDEFFRVRVSQLRQIKKVDKNLRRHLALKPNKTLKTILAEVEALQIEFGRIFSLEILPQLAKKGVNLVEAHQFNAKQQEYLEIFFEHQVSEHVTKVPLEETDALFFKDGAQYLVVVFEEESEDNIAVVSVPSDIVGRFVKIPSNSSFQFITFLEDVVKCNLQRLFPEREIIGSYAIKLSRDAELYLDDEYQGELAQQIYQSLAQRNVGQPTRLLHDPTLPKDIKKRLRKHLSLGKVDMIAGGKHHNFSDFFGFPTPTEGRVHFDELPPIHHSAFSTEENTFDLIEKKDRLVHYPYQSFEHLQDWVETAANDPDVTFIKISLYRVAKQSSLTNSLLKAVENGKEVTIFVEAQARFDEENNIKWGKIFEEKGAKVLYSIPNIKVHSKILLIERIQENTPKLYAYIGTGNFNAKTSKLYCDHGLFTANAKITADLKQVFEVLERKIILPKVKQLLVSPFNTRTTFEGLIQQEIENAQKGLPAKIIAKLNSLEDRRIIDRLYMASKFGVEIQLLVRGFCCLVPGVEGLSQNIAVTSIVDRYLEHGRIYWFCNNNEEVMYMGSADWMTRNLDRRIEVLTPILDQDVFAELKDILKLQLQDNVKARIIDEKSSNTYVRSGINDATIRSQYAIYEYLKQRHFT